MVSDVRGRRRDGWSKWAVSLGARGAYWVLRVPMLRELFLQKFVGKLAADFDRNEPDRQKLRHVQWVAGHLRAWLDRLICERPAATKAILRFLAAYMHDIYARTEKEQAGLPSPVTVVIEPTDRCNLNCPGCYARSTRDGADLSYDQLEGVVTEVVGMNVSLITLSGGEPFLRERDEQALTRLGARFPDRGFLIYTNGTLIDEPTADRMAAVGNIFPAISVEGFEHQTDARRGAGIGRANRRARKLMGDRGVMTGFSATVTRENCKAICSDDFIDMRIDEGDMFGWFFLLNPIGRSPRTDLMVTTEQRAMLRDTIYRWRQEDRPIFLGDFWNDGPPVGGCIAGGRYYFHIYANGDISPCVFSPVACGNIFDIIHGDSAYASLGDFVERHPTFRAFRDKQKTITDRARPCLLIDHPNLFRDVFRQTECRPAKNFPPTYVTGEIARAIDHRANEWRRWCATRLAPLPSDREAVPAGGQYETAGTEPASARR
ncbi:MAG: radical SAM protein [Phycisphaerae bacterium]|nr:radical SAM protein [Phycisphaerae bacterium]